MLDFYEVWPFQMILKKETYLIYYTLIYILQMSLSLVFVKLIM